MAQEDDLYVVKVIPENTLSEDQFTIIDIKSDDDLKNFIKPLQTNIGIKSHVKDIGFMFGDMTAIQNNNINAMPHDLVKGLRAIFTSSQIEGMFSVEVARKSAMDFWNNVTNKFPWKQSYVATVKQILDRLQSMIKRKSFLERRIHRYIAEYAATILPSHKRYFLDHRLFLGNEERFADFILEREEGFPPMLIELENPVWEVFTNKGEFTAKVNHAKNQIAEWVKFINQENGNTADDMRFLSGNKNRLVIIGKGLDNVDKLRDSKFTDTIVWTYDLLIKEAKDSVNKKILEQSKLLGVASPNLLT